MSQTATVEVFVIIDDKGDYAVGTSTGEATDRYEEDVQEVKFAMGTRMVQLSLTVPLPKLIELAGAIPDLQGEPVLVVKGS